MSNLQSVCENHETALNPVDASGPSPSASDALVVPLLMRIVERLDRIESRVAVSVLKETYTTEEVAKRLDKSEWTVRQWCNKGQAHAKKIHGRGRKGEWRISHDELVRLQNEGPLMMPLPRTAS